MSQKGLYRKYLKSICKKSATVTLGKDTKQYTKKVLKKKILYLMLKDSHIDDL